MKRIILLTALFTLAASTVYAGGVGISVSVAQPGFYGTVAVGGYPAPAMVYPAPAVVYPAPVVIRPVPYAVHPPVHAVAPGHVRYTHAQHEHWAQAPAPWGHWPHH